MIRRAPGLKLVVQTLLYSLKPIGNTVLIAAIFFAMFGILGVQVRQPSTLSLKHLFQISLLPIFHGIFHPISLIILLTFNGNFAPLN